MSTTHYDEQYFTNQLNKSDAKVNWQYGRVFALAGITPRGRLLDVGCGAGPGLRYAAAQGLEAVGVDFIHYSLAAARRLVPQAGIVEADVTSTLPFEAASFELLLLSEIVEHVADERSLLAESYRVLRSGGRIVVTTPNLWDARRVTARLGGGVWSGDTDPTHCNMFTPPRLARALRAAGFRGVFWRTGIKPVRWLSSRRLRLRLALPYPPVVGNGLLAVGVK